jgi:hypothetical protein
MIQSVKYNYNSLEDFVISNPLTVDGQLDDGWGAFFPVKGREIEATILFCDISGFSRRTRDLTPTEVLIFVNNFVSWISAEGVRGRPCIVDKYIGDEVMVIFSKEFGSENPFLEALQTGRWMCERDALSFSPHIGIASGLVTVGFIGTPMRYNCSVFGFPVTLASRCATIKTDGPHSASIVFPAELWLGRPLDEIFPPVTYEDSNGKSSTMRQAWQLIEKRKVPIKNLDDLEVMEIVKKVFHIPSQSAEDRAREALRMLRQAGLYRPKTA